MGERGAGSGERSKLDRRTFLGALAATAASPGFFSRRSPLSAPRSRLDRIGLQLYTVRDLLNKDFEGTLARVAEFGYREVEFAGYFSRTPEQVRAVLDRNGLTSPGVHVPFAVIDGGWEATLHTARLIGHDYVVCAWISEERRRTLDDWRRIGDRLNQAARQCREAGLQFAYHNHSYEFVPLGDRLPYDVLLESTDASLVKLELDLFWITYGGGDPLTYFARYPGRFPLVHVKDMLLKPTPDVAPERVMVDVGAGSIDWKRIFAHAADAGIAHYFVEHDDPPDPLASMRTSYQYLRRLEF